jgi:hypothetical protein
VTELTLHPNRTISSILLTDFAGRLHCVYPGQEMREMIRVAELGVDPQLTCRYRPSMSYTWRGRGGPKHVRLTLGPSAEWEDFQIGMLHELVHAKVPVTRANGRGAIVHGEDYRAALADAAYLAWGFPAPIGYGVKHQQSVIYSRLRSLSCERAERSVA